MKRFASTYVLILTFSLTSVRNNAFGVSINNLDSVLFDLSQAVYASNRVEFPVYFNSDDTINAVDFAFRYNQSNLILDTIIDISTGLQSTYFLNPGDSVLRFSSYNLNTIPNLTNVALVRFVLNSGAISISDLFDFDVFLNGFRCSYRIFDGTNLVETIDRSAQFSVFPVPTGNRLNLLSPTSGNFVMTDLQGRIVSEGLLDGGITLFLDASEFLPGTYSLSFYDSSTYIMKRILILE